MPDVKLTAWRNLLRAHAELVDALARELAEEHDLPISWYDVLIHLAEAPDRQLRMHELAESLLLSRSAATRFVDRMEKAGLVRREVCPTDRRGMFVVLTEEGRRRLREAAPTHLDGVARLFSANVTDEEAEVIAASLARVADTVRSGVPA
ncbi:MAG TPA: MarR family transcriptional regulator [Acidimicrobiia bacterium]|nr:MarR family transcriptional regulator [Acidimicrobiia bacterium]